MEERKMEEWKRETKEAGDKGNGRQWSSGSKFSRLTSDVSRFLLTSDV
jgi:hypothetical protein